MQPDPFLSQFYGTAPQPVDGDSLEKVAQLHLLEKMAEDEGLDLSGYSDDEILAITDQVFEDQDQEAAPEYDGGYQQEDHEKVAAARFEEADYLGRVMAHSMWNELDAIQKVARRSGSGAEEIGPMRGLAFEKKVKAERAAKEQARQEAVDAAKYEGPAQAGAPRRKPPKPPGRVSKAIQRVRGMSGRNKALAAGGAALLTAGGIAGARALKRRGQEKTGSAIDTMADAMAYDILAAHGYVDADGDVIPAGYAPGQPWEVPHEKTASAELDAVIEQLAMEKLGELGYLG